MRAIAVLLVCLAGVTACAEMAPKAVTNADRRLIQSIATSACECALTGKDNQCWARYRKMTAAFRPPNVAGLGQGATACAPVSTQSDCMEDAKGVFCVTTGYHVNGVDLEQPNLCRQSDAQAVEQGFNRGFEGPGGSQARAEREAKAALVAERSGTPVPSKPTDASCV